MTVALDIGASGLRSLRIRQSRLVARTCDAVYSVVADSAPRRQMLDQLGLEYAICDGALAIPGDSARDLAQLYQAPMMPLLPEGRLPQGDPPARQLLATLLDIVLPQPETPDELCGLTLPGESAASDPQDRETREFLVRLVQLRGYTPRIVSPGMAIVLAEMVSDAFTGIGISFGAAACHACLAHRGIEIAESTIPRGGHWIDEQVALAAGQYRWDADGERYVDVESIAAWKEACDESIDRPDDNERMQLLSKAYAELIDQVAAAIGREMRSTLLMPDAWPPMSIVACGGPTRIAGFAEVLDQAIRRHEWPVRVKSLRLANDADFTIPRGSLIQAEIDAGSPAEAIAAA